MTFRGTTLEENRLQLGEYFQDIANQLRNNTASTELQQRCTLFFSNQDRHVADTPPDEVLGLAMMMSNMIRKK